MLTTPKSKCTLCRLPFHVPSTPFSPPASTISALSPRDTLHLASAVMFWPEEGAAMPYKEFVPVGDGIFLAPGCRNLVSLDIVSSRIDMMGMSPLQPSNPVFHISCFGIFLSHLPYPPSTPPEEMHDRLVQLFNTMHCSEWGKFVALHEGGVLGVKLSTKGMKAIKERGWELEFMRDPFDLPVLPRTISPHPFPLLPSPPSKPSILHLFSLLPLSSFHPPPSTPSLFPTLPSLIHTRILAHLLPPHTPTDPGEAVRAILRYMGIGFPIRSALRRDPGFQELCFITLLTLPHTLRHPEELLPPQILSLAEGGPMLARARFDPSADYHLYLLLSLSHPSHPSRSSCFRNAKTYADKLLAHLPPYTPSQPKQSEESILAELGLDPAKFEKFMPGKKAKEGVVWIREVEGVVKGGPRMMRPRGGFAAKWVQGGGLDKGGDWMGRLGGRC